ncbi:MAG TPA: HEPN domain-containing protein [Candidatus Cloacimonadota bacterium]|nr:HEPN domain-containing protein [Candidatus Cloacimonadota bacterium]
MRKEELIKYWLDSAEMDFQSMKRLFDTGEFAWSLFLGQLVLEKAMKAVYSQKVGNNAPRLHDLNRLALLAGLDVSAEDQAHLDTISLFNINARYPDVKLASTKSAPRIMQKSILI